MEERLRPKGDSVIIKFEETLTLALSGNVDEVQRAQVQSLSQFPTTTDELIDRIRLGILDSSCTVQAKSELQGLLSRFVALVDEYSIEHS